MKKKNWELGGQWLISEKTEVLYTDTNKRPKAATGSFSVTGNYLHFIYSVSVTENHRNMKSRCLVHELSSKDIF